MPDYNDPITDTTLAIAAILIAVLASASAASSPSTSTALGLAFIAALSFTIAVGLIFKI